MWLKWFPWRWIIGRVARSKGFLDPIMVWSALRRFAQPSDVGEPIELLRAGVVFHARGLMNSRAIQHNLDWIWPYWVQRQFDPRDDAFVPRAFSITHINLTHRNWTAVGLPDCPALPIVDPRGLVTPFLDGWSLDGWVTAEDGRQLIPARLREVCQRLEFNDHLKVITEAGEGGLRLASEAGVYFDTHPMPVCRVTWRATADARGWLVVALRPYNPEGVSFVHDVTLEPSHRSWKVNGRHCVEFSDLTQQHAFSHYRAGDVFLHLPNAGDEHTIADDVGMATGAVLFELEPGQERSITVTVPLDEEIRSETPGARLRITPWCEATAGLCELRVPDVRIQFLYDAALRTLVLHSPGDIYPGPYTYKRFWFRDAAFIMNAMLCTGMTERAARVLDLFPARQSALGYFHSQEGEWDSNGEALWILHRYCELTGRPPREVWREAILKGARWIARKRTARDSGATHAGLLPAGFSAEHLGLNDFYYWDDFWSAGGLRAAAAMLEQLGEAGAAARARAEADDLMGCIERSLRQAEAALGRPAMPAAPARRLDAGAIGSLAAGYPLQLMPPGDLRLLDTVDYLMTECFFQGGFFQDMIHSGINPYLSLHVAQVLLRAGDPRWEGIMRTVAELASPTGQWPEAVHPRTKGGCMGDGQHVWAAAEWVMLLRNGFVREEGERLILASGVPAEWIESAAARGEAIVFGPAPTAFGPVTIRIETRDGRPHVDWTAQWRASQPQVDVKLSLTKP